MNKDIDMQNEKIHIERIKRFIARLKDRVYHDKYDMTAEYIYDQDNPIPYDQIETHQFTPIKKGEVWGKTWGSAWFKFHVKVPASHSDTEIGVWIDVDSEGCVWQDGTPYLGLTNKVDWYHNASKYFMLLSLSGVDDDEYTILVEAAANDLFGGGKETYQLKEAALVIYDPVLFHFIIDLEVLFNLAESLPEKTVRRQKILYGLNQVCNVWQDGAGMTAADQILDQLKWQPANASALTAYSIGHAHIDLAWLWPVRETKRKGGRTFSTALSLLKTYPEYKFGASQAQLYKWMRELYPQLYTQIRQAITDKRWEVQGAGWVEFDTNLISGESIIRQMLYGKRYFQTEFGISPDVLWLPDCFGFNGNLPQLMQGCGVNYFMTQKLSWNETNVFPHHLFRWEGIDGSQVIAHQLPTNDYNFSNSPASFLETEKRYSQSEVCDGFLNLYGIGDGGGGPSREHIEYGRRLQDLEGVSKFKFAFAQEFFDYVADLDPATLPKWFGELYLEFHRGTYTTQALMKKNNRLSEQLLHTAEFLAALTGTDYPPELTQVWEDTLLMQFHDIIPGSSIGWVYQDAKELSARNHALLREFIAQKLSVLTQTYSQDAIESMHYQIFNAQSWDRTEWVKLNDQSLGNWAKVTVPAYGYTALTHTGQTAEQLLPFSGTLENELLRVTLTSDGTISSIYDLVEGREVLAQPSNLLQLWEDEPNNWGAWDINHYYRDTVPQSPSEVKLLPEESFVIPGSTARAVFQIRIGKSTLKQSIELYAGERLIRFSHEVDWQENHRMLRVQFTPDLYSDTATFEIQMGVIKRPTKHNNPWQQAQFEVPAHSFADLSQPDYGAALINDCKYGYRIVDNQMELNLLRSPADVDPQADLHVHTYRYAFYPHTGDYERSDVLKTAHCFNSPLLVQPVPQLPEIGSHSYFYLNSDSVKLETVKPTETGDGYILRMYEYKGKATLAKLGINLPYAEIFTCNMLEQDITPLAAGQNNCYDREFSLPFKPFEVRTLYLKRS